MEEGTTCAQGSMPGAATRWVGATDPCLHPTVRFHIYLWYWWKKVMDMHIHHPLRIWTSFLGCNVLDLVESSHGLC